MFWWRNRNVDQRDGIKNLEIEPYKYDQLIFDKGEKAVPQQLV